MRDTEDDGRTYTVVVNGETTVSVDDTATAEAAVADMAVGQTLTIHRTR